MNDELELILVIFLNDFCFEKTSDFYGIPENIKFSVDFVI